MTTLSIVHPTHLVAAELRETLDRRRDLWQRMHLLSTDPDEVGTLTEVRGEAAVVAAPDEASFDGVDVAFFFGKPESYAKLIDTLPKSTLAVVAGESAAVADGLPVVAGLNLDQVESSGTLLSPHPAALTCSLLLKQLSALRPRRLAATVLQPASVFGNAGLDDLLEQTRAMMTFQSPQEVKALPADLAFNVFQTPGAVDGILEPLKTLVGEHLPDDFVPSVQVLQTSVFHAYGLAMQLEFEEDPGLDALGAALEGGAFFDLDVHPHQFGPKQAVAQERMLVGPPQSAAPGVYSLWAAVDNLTLAGAANLLAILEALAPQLIKN